MSAHHAAAFSHVLYVGGPDDGACFDVALCPDVLPAVGLDSDGEYHKYVSYVIDHVGTVRYQWSPRSRTTRTVRPDHHIAAANMHSVFADMTRRWNDM